MSVMIRFGVAGFTDDVGVDSQSSARAGDLGSIQRYISCGSAVGVYVAISGGSTGSAATSKKRMLKRCAVSGQAWMTRLQRKDMTIRNPWAGQTRSPRAV